MLSQTGTEAVRTGDNDAIGNAEFQKCVANGADFLKEILVRHSHLAVLVATLFFIRNLIFDLESAGTGLDHLLRKKVGCLGIAEPRVDIGDDRDDMRLMLVDGFQKAMGVDCISCFLRRVEFAEQAAEFACIRLFQESVEFFDQRGHACLLVHGLVWKRSEFATQRGDHPSGQVEVTAFGAAEVLLDRNHLLLSDEAVPRAERLRVVRRIPIIRIHVFAHDPRSVARNVEPGAETVLNDHARSALSIDRTPWRTVCCDGFVHFIDPGRVGHGSAPCRYRLDRLSMLLAGRSGER